MKTIGILPVKRLDFAYRRLGRVLDTDERKHLRVTAESEDLGHCKAAASGVRVALELGADGVAMLPIDCPLFDPTELDKSLGQTPRAALIVPDRHGAGTNALVLSPPDLFEPAFGRDSCAKHVAQARSTGRSFAIAALESLAVDLVTSEDLRELCEALLLHPKRAPRSAKVLWKLHAARQASASSAKPAVMRNGVPNRRSCTTPAKLA